MNSREMMMRNLTGGVAIVTGASRGIGAATAEVLAASSGLASWARRGSGRW